MKQRKHNYNHAHSKGLALVELMIAMALGLVLIGAATGIMMSNTQTFKASKITSQVQDSARLAFELMARDIRQAGSIPCGSDIPVENYLSDSTPWYVNWEGLPKQIPGTVGQASPTPRGQLIGYAGDFNLKGVSNKVNEEKTQSITVLYASNEGTSVKKMSSHANAPIYTLTQNQNTFTSGDIAVICNTNFASIFKAEVTHSDNTVQLSAPTSNTDNSTENIKNTTNNPGIFKKNSTVGKLKSRAWYIGLNEKQQRALYLADFNGKEIQEILIASNVTELTFEYRASKEATFKDAAKVTEEQLWPMVNAVKITLKIEDQDNPKINERFSSEFTSIVALRNRSQ